MKQQHEFLEKQEEREKELATSVKLLKLDMHTFSGDKMKWYELLHYKEILAIYWMTLVLVIL